MRQLITMLLLVSTGPALVASRVDARLAQSPGQPAAGKPAAVRACSLLTKEEMKKFAGANNPLFDKLAPEEDSVGSHGSGCNYPGVYIQVNPFTPARLEELRKTTGKGWTAVPDVGDAAYFQHRSTDYAELYARRGPHVVTVQMDVPTGQSVEAVRPAAVALARALIAKLP
jgi:hypothetical protein